MKHFILFLAALLITFIEIKAQAPHAGEVIKYKCINSFNKQTKEPVPEDLNKIATFCFKSNGLIYDGLFYKFEGLKGSVYVYHTSESKYNGYYHGDYTIKISVDFTRINRISETAAVIDTYGTVSRISGVIVYTNDLNADLENSGLY